MDVGFSLKKGGKAGAKGFRAFLELDDEKVAAAEWDAAFDEERLDRFGVADNESGDGNINGVLKAKAEDQHMSIAEQTDHAEEGTGPVDQKDGELFDVGACGRNIGFHA